MGKSVVIVVGFFLVIAISIVSAQDQSFILNVEKERVWGRSPGKLIITADGIEYASDKPEESRKWIYQDLRRIEIASRKQLNLVTYEDRKYRFTSDKKYEFALREGEISDRIYYFLLSKATRPLIARISVPLSSVTFTLPVEHQHRFGRGCQGELKFSEDRVVYHTENSPHARTWLYRDITSVGLMDPYSFRLTTLDETDSFALKVAMSQQQYDFVWAKVYRLESPYLDNPTKSARRGSMPM